MTPTPPDTSLSDKIREVVAAEQELGEAADKAVEQTRRLVSVIPPRSGGPKAQSRLRAHPGELSARRDRARSRERSAKRSRARNRR